MRTFAFPFRYCTVDYLRDEIGIDAVDLPDARALRLIERASSRINLVTGQWFVPAPIVDMRVNGQNLQHVLTQDVIPIIRLDEVALVDEYYISPYILAQHEWVIHQSRRMVIRKPPYLTTGRVRALWQDLYQPYFPENWNSVRLKGVFGWVDEHPAGASNVTSTDITPASTSVEVVAPSLDIQAGDVVNVLDAVGDEITRFIVTNVAGTVVSFDPLPRLRQTIAAGAPLVVWGRVPEDIQEACARLVLDYKAKLGSEDGEDQVEYLGRLRSESTDGYSYSLAGNRGKGFLKGDPTGAWNTTGDTVVDELLSNWRPPAYIEAV